MTLPLDADSRTLKKVLDSRGGARPVLDSVDYFYSFRAKRIIEGFRVTTLNGRVGMFRNPFVVKPTVITLSNDEEPAALWPADARRNRLSYMGRVFAEFAMYENARDEDPVDAVTAYLGKMPVMVGSELCHTHGLTQEERYERGEPVKDPQAYFIVKGSEKVLLNVEKLRASTPIMYEGKQSVVVRYTSPTLLDSTVNLLTESNFDVIFSFTKLGLDTAINVFYVFTLLGVTAIQDVLTSIDHYIVDDDPIRQQRRRQNMRVYMETTIQAFLRQTDNGDPRTIINVLAGKVRDTAIKNAPNKEELVVELVRENVFKNIPYTGLSDAERETSLRTKVRLLSSMVAMFADYKNGYRSIDSRDDESYKQWTDPGKHLSTRFVQIWHTMMTAIQKGVTDKKIETAQRAVKQISQNAMADMFVSSFSKDLWGGATNDKDVSIVDQLNRDNLIASLSQLRRITKPVYRRGTPREKRLVHNTQYGVVCPVTTPESGACGLVSDAGIATYVSLERDPSLVEAYLVRGDAYVDYPEDGMRNPLMFNGVPLGFCDGESLWRHMLSLRRTQQQIPFDTGIVFDENGTLWILTTESRVCRPQLLVNQDTLMPIIDEKNLRHASMGKLLDEGAIEYIDVAEQNRQARYTMAPNTRVLQEARHDRDEIQRVYAEVMDDPDETDARKESVQVAYTNIMGRVPYTHSAIDPVEILGLGTTLMPFMEHNPAPRVTYQSAMIRQALGRDAGRANVRFDTTARTMVEPGVPTVATSTHEMFGLDEYPQGQQVIVAITTYGGTNQEDAIIFNQDAVERGMFNMAVYYGYSNLVCQTKNRQEKIMLPESIHPSKADKYKHIDPSTGLVRLGANVVAGDALIGKVAVDNTTGERRNESLFVEIGKQGVVEEVYVTENAEACKLIRIRLREFRKIKAGDKFASRYSQKGTIGYVMPGEDMPWIASDDPRLDGVRPHIIFNPHGIPSRMTTGKLYEMLTGTLATETGERFNATAFRRYNNRDVQQELSYHGFSPSGQYTMVNGITGREMDVKITVGPIYYQLLRHLVDDKMQARNRGTNDFYTHQPVSGIRREGGLRFGEMERDALIAYGSADLIRERMMISSDEWNGVVCRTCGNYALENVERGDIKCRICKLDNFVQIKTPYSFKSLTHLLAGVNAKLSINTG